MGAAKGKKFWRNKVEQLLATDVPVAEWCDLNRIPRASMYYWLSAFADEEPGMFGGQANIVDRSRRRWVESTRNNMKRSKEMIPARRNSSEFMVIDTNTLDLENSSRPSDAGSQHAIVVVLKGIDIAIPSGTQKVDIENVLEAVAAL